MLMVSNAVSLAKGNWWGPGLRFVQGPFLVPFAHQALKESEAIAQSRQGSPAQITSQGCPWCESRLSLTWLILL